MNSLTTSYNFNISNITQENPLIIEGFLESPSTEYSCGFFEMNEMHYIDVLSKVKVPIGMNEIQVYGARTRFIIPLRPKDKQYEIICVTHAILADFVGKHLCLHYHYIAPGIKGHQLTLPSLYEIYSQLKDLHNINTN